MASDEDKAARIIALVGALQETIRVHQTTAWETEVALGEVIAEQFLSEGRSHVFDRWQLAVRQRLTTLQHRMVM